MIHLYIYLIEEKKKRVKKKKKKKLFIPENIPCYFYTNIHKKEMITRVCIAPFQKKKKRSTLQ
jgi:hypothetical protein